MDKSASNLAPPASCAPIFFDATLRPHRSLGRTGFIILMGFISSISLTTGIAYFLVGAWPVLGFYGLNVLAVYGAFKWTYWSGRLYETVRMTEKNLEIQRVHPNGRWERWNFQPYWVRMTIDKSSEDDPRIGLSERGVSVRLGAFLSGDERLEFAQALENAIGRARTFGEA